MADDVLRAALWYAAHGWVVFPCRVRGKEPLTPRGYKDASSDPDVIRAWWAQWPDANIGLPCEPNGLLVLDVDVHGETDGRETLGDRELPVTPTADTGGGGVHYLFAAPDWKPANSAGPGLDIRYHGYIVVPPSIHPSGTPYVWREGLAPRNLAPAELPLWLIEQLHRGRKSSAPSQEASSSNGAPASDSRMSDAEIALASLERLTPQRADDHDLWVQVGMALHRIDAGPAMLAAWDRWSRSSAKYEVGVCARRWESFNATRGDALGVSALIAWARETEAAFLTAGWRSGSNGRSASANGRAVTATANGQANGVATMTAPTCADPFEGESPPTIRPQIIVTGRQLREKIEDATAALELANEPPTLYVRSGDMVRVRRDESGWPGIERLRGDSLRGYLANIADWLKLVKGDGPDGSGWQGSATDPPLAVVQSVLAAGDWRLPPLEGVTPVPVLRPDGSLLSQPGYDPATRLVFLPPDDLQLPPIPETPTAAELQAAVALVDSIVGEFPYVDEASRANLLGLFLTPLVRPAIDGRVPLAVVDAPSPGTGKSLLVEALAIAVTGQGEFTTCPADEEEWRKKLTTVLLGGASIVAFDNIEGVLKSPHLALALTTDIWSDRGLGTNENIRAKQRATWIVTGNNVSLAGDLPRRCYWIRLDALSSRPWERGGFRIPDLRAHVRANRGELLAALLTIARSWFAAGCPEAPSRVLGSFEHWCRMIGGMVAHAGLPGFLGNLDEMYEHSDEDAPAWEALLRALLGVFGDRPFVVKDIAGIVEEAPSPNPLFDDPARAELRDCFPPELVDPRGNVKSVPLGTRMKHRADRRYGSDGIRLVRDTKLDKHTKRMRWRVELDASGASRHEQDDPFAPLDADR